jgi:hypothetical protein
MRARLSLPTAWTALVLTPLALGVGHAGAHELSWMNNQVSTFAARAPNDAWVTGGMVLAALGLLCLGISIPLRRPGGAGFVEQLLTALSGTAASGLLLLRGSGWRRRALGVLVGCAGPAAFASLTTPWPRLLGVAVAAPGLRQRGAFLCLWAAALLLLSLLQSAPLARGAGADPAQPTPRR